MPTLTRSPEQIFIEDALLPDWDPSTAVGFDVNASPGDDGFVPVGTSLDDVGEVYPHLTVARTNETAPGSTTYNFIGPDGDPGQDRTGQLLVAARVERDAAGYTGDPNQYTAVDAERLADRLIEAVEDVALANATATSTPISPLGSQRGADAPNDYDATPPVFIEQATITYYYART